MTSFETGEMSCPQCGHIQTVGFYRSVNVTVSPELRETIFHTGLNIVNCDRCGARGFLPVPLLYHDMAHRFLILLDSTHALTPNTEHIFEIFTGHGVVPDIFQGMLTDNGPHYRMRVVRDYDRLLEKIIIFETGLDDRIIEILSCLISMRMLKDREPLPLSVYFEDLAIARDGEELLLFRIFHKDEPWDSLYVPKDTIYQEVHDSFIAYCDDCENESPVYEVDQEYATRLFLGRGS